MDHQLDQLDPDSVHAAPRVDLLGELPAEPFPVDSVYLHVPFCFHKCHYCDFYSIVDSSDRQGVFLERMEHEIDLLVDRISSRIGTIFIGGGTPTLLRVDLFSRLLNTVRNRLPLADDVEWTVEANPETVDADIARAIADGGVTRVSIGCQSFQPELLARLERHHDPASVVRALDHLRGAGVEAFNLDLIHGIPGSSLEDWEDDLRQALALGPEHLSCYGLQYEPNTPMTMKLITGRIDRLDEETEARMYEYTCDRLADEGFVHYEISNWSRPGAECRHNLAYWRGRNWLAFGPSGSGHLEGMRWKVAPRLSEWLEAGETMPVIDLERIDETVRVVEHLMLEFRLRAGIAESRLEALLERADPEGRRRRAIDGALRDGLLVREGGFVRLSDRGVLLSDSLLSELI